MPFDGMQRIKDWLGDDTSRETEATPPASLPSDPVLEALVAARARIEKPEHWCQGAVYRDGARCAIGAVHNAGPNGSRNLTRPACEAWGIVDDLCGSLHGMGAVAFNNSHAHADVLSLFDRAINARKQDADAPYSPAEGRTSTPEA